MADTMKFGPEWLRALSDGGAGAAPSPPVAPRPGVKIAEYRYGREEMLALFQTSYDPPEHLRNFPNIFVEETQKPIVMLPLSEDEQRIMSQGVNSTVVLRTGRGGGPPLRGGRGGSIDRGRGRGRGRGEGFSQRSVIENGDIGGFGRPRGPNKDGWEEVGRKMDRSYSRPYDETGSGSHPRYTRSMSDNWREKGAGDEEDDGDWRKAGRERWSTRTNWRESGRGGPDSERRNGAFSRGRGFEYDERGRRVGEPWESEDVPEWADDGADDVGTFDSSGAFVSTKVQARGGFLVDEGSIEDQFSADHEVLRSQQEDKESWRRRPQDDRTEQPLPEPPEQMANGMSPPPGGNSEATSTSLNASPSSVPVASMSSSQPSHAGVSPDGPATDTAVQQADMADEVLIAEAVSEAQDSGDGGQTGDDENALKWFYTDPQGEMQGPFSADEMSQWFSAGYFTMSLLVKRGCDQQFHPLGELIKRWGRVPFLPGPALPPVLPNTSAAVEVTPISTQPGSLQQPLPTSVPAPVPPPSFPPPEVSQATDPLLLQQQLLLRQQVLHQQVVIRQLQLQTLAQLQEQDSFKVLDPLQQQQVGLQVMQTNPLLLQQMQTLQHLQQMQQAQSQTPPALAVQSQSQQSSVEVGLSASPPSFHRSLSQPVPASDGQGDIPSIWGSLPPSGAWSQPNSVWDLEGGSAAVMPNVKLELDKMRQEKEAELARLAEEERKRQEEIMHQQEELRRQQEALQREREQMQREKEELEHQRQMEIQRLEEARRQQEEAKKRREQEEAERRRQMEEAAEKKRRAEEQRLEEEERRRQEEERRRQEEQRRVQEEEKERQRQEDIRRKREAEELLEMQRQEELRQQQEAERLQQQREAERQQEELEAQRKQEFQRQQQEALRRLQQQQQLANMQLPSTANWARQQHQSGSSSGPSRSLAEIQQEEEKQHQQQIELQRQRMLQVQAEQISQQQQQQQKSWASNFAAQQPARPKTLAEIQEEEERQLRQEKQKRQQQQQYQAKNMSLSSAAVWGSGPSSSSSSAFTSSSSAAWGGGSVWGSENSVSLWGDSALPQSSTGGSHNSKGKKSGKDSAPSSEFPALKTSKATSKSQQASNRAAVPPKPKKEEEAVQRLFQQKAQQKDEFTVWCEAFLEGMEVTVDIETFVSFLQAVDSPYEIHDYVKNYLGEGKDAREFAKQFMEKRSHYKNKARTEKRMEEESIWGPAPAINPREVRGVPQQINSDHGHAHGDGGKSKGGKKKKKMQKLDGSALLGFTVEKDPNRKNAGEIESFP